MTKRSALLLTTAAVFLALGVIRGEAAMVLQKGTKLCLECVGIG